MNFIIDEENKVIICHAAGVLTFERVHEFRARMKSDKRFKRDYRQMLDLRDLTSIPLDSAQIRQLAEEHVFEPDAHRAFVVSTGLQHGLGRMFSAFREVEGEKNIGVFRTLEEAVHWLGIPVEAAKRALEALRAPKSPKP
jgi:hypothetical protein